ncbi:hypothetical protein LTR06_011523, partial [Exophiala xenobiotica]
EEVEQEEVEQEEVEQEEVEQEEVSSRRKSSRRKSNRRKSWKRRMKRGGGRQYKQNIARKKFESSAHFTHDKAVKEKTST